MLAWLSVLVEVQTCIRPSWCHCHSLSLASVKSRLVLPFWYWLTRVVVEKGPLNGCVCVCVCVLRNQGSMPVSFAVGCAVIPAGGRLVISPVQIVVATQASRAVSVRSQRNNPHVEIENGFVANYINNGSGWHSDLQTTLQQTAFWTVYCNFTSHTPHIVEEARAISDPCHP